MRLSVPSQRLLDPAAAEWASAPQETLALEPTPVGSQPSQYVINAWKDRPYGLVGGLQVAAAHNGEALFFRLGWPDESEDREIADTDRFADAAAVLIPVRRDAPLQSMGSPEQPVSAWYWRADMDAPLTVSASGLGTTVRHANGALSAAALREGRDWRVVVSRPFKVEDDTLVPLHRGMTTKVAFAVWQGSNQERAGIKAVTPDWRPLRIEE